MVVYSPYSSNEYNPVSNEFSVNEEIHTYTGNSTNINAEVQQYKDDYSYILSKTAETVTIEDKDKIDAALLTYSQLSEMAQSQLLSEKTLLDALKQKVDEIITGVDYVTIDEYSVNIYTLSGKKVQSVQKGQFYIINSKKILIK